MYFCCAIEPEDNELITLEIIHRYVELLDKYFGSVSSKNMFLSIFPFYTVGIADSLGIAECDQIVEVSSLRDSFGHVSTFVSLWDLDSVVI